MSWIPGEIPESRKNREIPFPDRKNSTVAELSGVYKRYGRTVALDGIDLEIPGEKLLAVLGPNGAGKTTAISLLLGLPTPDDGKATLLGQSPLNIKVRRQVGVMLPEPGCNSYRRDRKWCRH
jgi:ABC-2 type transport system ATP-binding protein